MNNAEYEQLITKAPLHPIERSTAKRDAVTDQWVTPLPVDTEVKFTAWERLTMSVDATIAATKFIGVLTPHIVSIIWSYMMGNKTKLSIAIVGLIVAVCGHLGFVIPESFIPFIDTAVALLLGWLIPAPTTKKAE